MHCFSCRLILLLGGFVVFFICFFTVHNVILVRHHQTTWVAASVSQCHCLCCICSLSAIIPDLSANSHGITRLSPEEQGYASAQQKDMHNLQLFADLKGKLAADQQICQLSALHSRLHSSVLKHI